MIFDRTMFQLSLLFHNLSLKTLRSNVSRGSVKNIETQKGLPFRQDSVDWNQLTQTFRGVVFNRLLKGCDVAERAKEEDHLLLFISNRGNLHEKPNWCP